MKERITEELKPKKLPSLPDRGLLYDYNYQMKSNGVDGEWILWIDLIDKTEVIPATAEPQQIIVKI